MNPKIPAPAQPDVGAAMCAAATENPRRVLVPSGSTVCHVMSCVHPSGRSRAPPVEHRPQGSHHVIARHFPDAVLPREVGSEQVGFWVFQSNDSILGWRLLMEIDSFLLNPRVDACRVLQGNQQGMEICFRRKTCE